MFQSHPNTMANIKKTDFNVCSKCGSLHECLHDMEDDISEIPPSASRLPRVRGESTHAPPTMEFDLYYEMVSNTPIIPDTEVFNTYGETLTNAQLLAQYGFILDGNDNDHLSWDIEFAVQFGVNSPGIRLPGLKSIWAAVLQNTTQNGILRRFSESNLVYHQVESSGDDLRLNGDGKISHQLWVFFALSSFLEDRCIDVEIQLVDVMTVVEGLKSLLELQLTLEPLLDSLDDTEDHIHTPQSWDDPAVSMLTKLVHSVIRLCSSRKHPLDDIPDGQDLNTILDVSVIRADRNVFVDHSLVKGDSRGYASRQTRLDHRNRRAVSFRQLQVRMGGNADTVERMSRCHRRKRLARIAASTSTNSARKLKCSR